MALWMLDIDVLTIFWAIADISSETAWKKIVIWSDETKSGNFDGSSEMKSRKLLIKFGTSKTKACNWVYKSGTSQITRVAPVTIKIEKVITRDTFSLIL